ncbi:UNVERIFIED_CONTAM: hypothetical protein FKN15_029801 [Acipenser sinensis]
MAHGLPAPVMYPGGITLPFKVRLLFQFRLLSDIQNNSKTKGKGILKKIPHTRYTIKKREHKECLTIFKMYYTF